MVIFGQVDVQLELLFHPGGIIDLHRDLHPAPGNSLFDQVAHLSFQGIQPAGKVG